MPRNVVIPSFDVASRWVGPAEEKKVAAHNLKRARALECSATFEDAKLGGIRGRSLQWFRTTYVNGKAQKVEDYNEVVRGQAWQKCGLGRLESDEAKLVAALEIAFRKRAAQALTKVMTRFPGATPFDPFKDSPEPTRPRPAAKPAPQAPSGSVDGFLLPQRLGHEQMDVRCELKARPEPLPEANTAARQRARRAVTPGLAALPPPYRLHQPHLEGGVGEALESSGGQLKRLGPEAARVQG